MANDQHRANFPGLHRALVENSVDLVTLVDTDGIVQYQNPAVETYLGLTPEDVIGRSIFDLIHPDDAELAIRSFQYITERKDIDRVTIRMRDADGEVHYLEAVASAYSEGDQALVVLNARDVTSQHEISDALAQSEEMFRKVFHEASNVHLLFDMQSRVLVDVNAAWEEQIGHTREESIGRTAYELGLWNSIEDRDTFLHKLYSEGRLVRERVVIRDKARNTKIMLVDAVVLKTKSGELAYMDAEDISDKEQIELQLRQSQRMEAVGQLTGGIAHDFNNMLSVILGYIELSTDRYLSQQEVRQTMTTIRAAVERGAELVQKLMAFSRKQNLNPTPVRLDDVLQDTLLLLERTLGSTISLHTDTVRNEWQCFVDRGMLENAIVNMALNSRDAMPGGGTITFIADDVHMSPDDDAPPADYVRLEIMDDGAGMDSETAATAFEPFFTTKGIGEGTGLGLSMVYGFVKQSNGHIQLSSAPGHGTTICILLPRLAGT